MIRLFQVITLFLVKLTSKNLPGNQEEKNKPKKNKIEPVCFSRAPTVATGIRKVLPGKLIGQERRPDLDLAQAQETKI